MMIANHEMMMQAITANQSTLSTIKCGIEASVFQITSCLR